MTPESWQQIDQIFHEALQYPPGERAAFVAVCCGCDEHLRGEVESLLASHEQAASFIEVPAGDAAAELLTGPEARLTPGTMLSRYQILNPLGTGGMGEVYLAQDTKLSRKIALKLLPRHFTISSDRMRRFEHEARAVSALNHPNIVTLHEIERLNDTNFIVTEYVEGQTLRQLISQTHVQLSDALDLAIQIAGALDAAHAAGIVHRDIKPENIMVRRDGYVKVLDFGLAKLAGREIPIPRTKLPAKDLLNTDPGSVIGTVSYMSPEQSRGGNVDARSDIWSLGVVLYELLTGRVPFTGETPSQVMVSLINDEVPPLTGYANVPAQLDRIITKALSKNPEQRYPTAGELASELKNLKQELQLEARLKGLQETLAREENTIGAQTSPLDSATTETLAAQSRPTSSAEYVVKEIKRHKAFAMVLLLSLFISAIGVTRLFLSRKSSNLTTANIKSVAVLPVKPINTAKRDEIYEIGIADSLIRRLSLMKGFVVRPLDVTRKYTTPDQDPIAAGLEQQVDYVLAANYELAEGKVRITAQLFNVAAGQIEKTYQSGERESSDVLAIEDAIAEEIGKNLFARFSTSSTSTPGKRETTNKEAYLLYLQGKDLLWAHRSPQDVAKARKYFEQAVQVDPNYARAYAGMAHASVTAGLGSHRGGPTRVEIENIRNIINKAFALDSNLAEAYAARADFALKYEWDFPAVERDLISALALEPNDDVAHWLYALLSAYRGNFDKAMEEIEAAQSVDPSNLLYKRDRGRIFYYSHRYDEAIVQFKRVIELNENYGGTYLWLSNAYDLKGDYADAYGAFIKLQQQDNPDRIKIYEKAYETGGWQKVRQKQLEFAKGEMENSPVFLDAAVLCGLLGKKDQALAYLDKAVAEREWTVIMLNVEPTLDSLRGDPRFAELIRRAGLK